MAAVIVNLALCLLNVVLFVVTKPTCWFNLFAVVICLLCALWCYLIHQNRPRTR
jgi:hypothetical protein